MKKLLILCLLALGGLSASAQKTYIPGVSVSFGDRFSGPHGRGCAARGICDLGFMNRVGGVECSTCPLAEAEISVVSGRAAFRFKKSSFENGAANFFTGSLFQVDSMCAFSAKDLEGSGIEPFKVAPGKYKIVDQGEFFFIQF